MSSLTKQDTEYRSNGMQSVSVTNASSQSDAVGDYTHAITVMSHEDMFINFGMDPTVTDTNGIFALQDWVYTFQISPGEKVAAKLANTSSSSGIIRISELTK